MSSRDLIAKLLERKSKFNESIDVVFVFQSKQANKMYINTLPFYKSKLDIFFKEDTVQEDSKKRVRVRDKSIKRGTFSFIYPVKVADKDLHKLINMSLVPANYSQYSIESLKSPESSALSRLYFREFACQTTIGNMSNTIDELEQNFNKHLEFIKTITSTLKRVYFKTTQSKKSILNLKLSK